MIIWMMVLQTATIAPAPARSMIPMVRLAPASEAPEFRERYSVDFKIESGKTLLQAGTLRVAEGVMANFRRDTTEASDERCSNERRGVISVQRSLNLQITPSRYDAVDRLTVSLRWGRPVDGACPMSQAARLVEMNDSVVLTPGKTVTLTGDAGLTLTLTRR